MDDPNRDEQISEVITPIIKELLDKVTFDPNTEEVVFIREPHHINYLKPKDFQDMQGNQYLHQVLPDVKVEIAPDWINSPIFRNPITHLSVNNLRGMNDDDRSHRGDDLPEDFIVPDQFYEHLGADLPEDELEEQAKLAFVQDLDNRNFKPHWRLQNTAGITWGNLMNGIMWAKGSKFDKWYELFANAHVSFPEPNLMKVELDFDHGS